MREGVFMMESDMQNQGNKWTPREDRQLLNQLDKTIGNVAAKHKRGKKAIIVRLDYLYQQRANYDRELKKLQTD
jgi:hypothetical protein